MIAKFRVSVLLIALAGGAAIASNATVVGMGQALPLSLPRDASHVVLGNPAIADVTLQSPRDMVLFGKYPGGTTLLVTDQAGKPILRTSILVTAADSNGVTIHYGTGKTWVPGGTVTAAACGGGRCAPAAALPPAQSSSSVSGK